MAIPSGDGVIQTAHDVLKRYETEHGEIGIHSEHDPEAAARLLEYEKSLRLIQNSVANDKRDLTTADAAAVALRELEQSGMVQAPSDEEIATCKAGIDKCKQELSEIQSAVKALEDAHLLSSAAARKTRLAADLHRDIQQWEAIAAALAPDSIPGEMLAEALEPINDRLAMTAKLAGWKVPRIDGDMDITASGRSYSLLSESEKWRADCLMAEAVSHVSGIRLLVLDRFDVLDSPGRNDLIFWLADMADAKAFDTAIVLGTMRRDQLEKARPGLPDNFGVFWIEEGTNVTEAFE
jgi:hypothetical protein